MQIVGLEITDQDGPHVHTIDVWFSEKRQVWCVERLDAAGHQVGLSHSCANEMEAAACLGEWLRDHRETHLVAPRTASVAEKRILSRAA